MTAAEFLIAHARDCAVSLQNMVTTHRAHPTYAPKSLIRKEAIQLVGVQVALWKSVDYDRRRIPESVSTAIDDAFIAVYSIGIKSIR